MVLEEYGCAVCGTGLEENVEHLFLKCPFAIQCWASLNVNSAMNLEHLQILGHFKKNNKDNKNIYFFILFIVRGCIYVFP